MLAGWCGSKSAGHIAGELKLPLDGLDLADQILPLLLIEDARCHLPRTACGQIEQLHRVANAVNDDRSPGYDRSSVKVEIMRHRSSRRRWASQMLQASKIHYFRHRASAGFAQLRMCWRHASAADSKGG